MKNGQKAKIHQSCLSSTQSNISACMNLIFSGFFARHINRKRRGFMDWKMESFDVRYSCEQIAKNVHLFSFWEPFWHRQTQTKPTSIAIRSYMAVGDFDYFFPSQCIKGRSKQRCIQRQAQDARAEHAGRLWRQHPQRFFVCSIKNPFARTWIQSKIHSCQLPFTDRSRNLDSSRPRRAKTSAGK